MHAGAKIYVSNSKTKIETAFQRHALRDAKAIRVTVGDGHVTLEGEVHSWQEREDSEIGSMGCAGRDEGA